ncbi:MAG: DUF4838 domain-containing protein [Candidatus Latescibacterota bacterium]
MSIHRTFSGADLDTRALDGWSIGLPADATPAEEYAAAELRDWVERATGARLRLGAPGRPEAAQVVLANAAGMGEEGFSIELEPQGLRIQGGRPRGVLYGVYQFLEEALRVRFLAYHHTHVPSPPPRRIPCGTWAYAPPFSFRWSYYRENADYPEFAARLRVNTVSDEPRLGGRTPQHLINHSVHQWVPFARWGSTHPEYYALYEGKRDTDTHGGGPQLCVTNPEVVEVAARAVIEHLNAHPQLRNISVSQADTARYCHCPACEAVNEAEGSPMGSNLQFVNAVAERVERIHPQVKVGTLAYWYTRHRPHHLRPRPNVQIQLCSIECCTLHAIDSPFCPRNGEFCRDMDEWAQVCQEIWIWNYNTNFRAYDLPLPNLRSIGRNVHYFLRSGAKGVFMQANGDGRTGELCDLRNYMIGRMLWDPEQDYHSLMCDFCELHYGPASNAMLDYITMLHDNAEERDVHPNCFPSAADVGLDAEVSRRIMGHFDRALAAAPEAEIRSRVERAWISAHRACIETQAWADAAERQQIIARYVELARRHGMTRAAEGRPAEDFFATLPQDG